MTCYCCSGKLFTNCCQPFLLGLEKPSTAEALMRSRYSAYATLSIDYLLNTTHISTRMQYNAASIEKWAKESTWQKLEILKTEAGSTVDATGKVEFKAYYLDAKKRLQVHHEYSTFKKELGDWYFVDGKIK